jgi:tRNA(fMet)-specific endonuclease VapC
VSASTPREFLLDTNIIIALFGASQNLKWQLAYDLQYWLPCVVVGELIYGAYYSAEIRQNLLEIEAFIETVRIATCDRETGQYYGRIKGDLRGRGKLIPDNDIWIAAMSMQRQLTLITRDSHFNCIQGLSFESW